MNQLHLICLSHLTTSEAIFTSSVKKCDWTQHYPEDLSPLKRELLNGPREVIYFKGVVAALIGLVQFEQKAIGSYRRRVLLRLLEDILWAT